MRNLYFSTTTTSYRLFRGHVAMSTLLWNWRRSLKVEHTPKAFYTSHWQSSLRSRKPKGAAMARFNTIPKIVPKSVPNSPTVQTPIFLKSCNSNFLRVFQDTSGDNFRTSFWDCYESRPWSLSIHGARYELIKCLSTTWRRQRWWMVKRKMGLNVTLKLLTWNFDGWTCTF